MQKDVKDNINRTSWWDIVPGTFSRNGPIGNDVMDDDTVQLKAVICAAEEAFCKRDFDLAYEQFKKFADMGYPFPMFRCALILEYGWSKRGVDADRAHEYYKAMVSYFDDCYSRIDEDDDLKEEGFLGCARYILIKKDRESKEKALYYCSKAS